MEIKEKKVKLDMEKSEFKQEIGVFGGMSILGGIMIGGGIFYLGSYVLMRTGMSLGLSLLCWLIGGLISLLGGLCFAELGVTRPVAGGMVVYLNEAYHPIVGFMHGFCSWAISGSGSIAAVAIALPMALRTFLNISDVGVKAVAIAIIIGLTFYNYCGIKKGTILQNISMIAKLIPIIIIIIGALFFGKQSPDLSLAVADGNTHSFSSILGMIAFATIATLWAYEGWTNLNNVVEEMKNPKRNLPLALIIAISGVAVIYMLFNYSIYKVIPYGEIVSMVESENLYLGTEAAIRIFGSIGGIIVLVGMAISAFSSLNGMIIAFPRTYYAMAAEGHFFKSYGKLHPKFKVPSSALIAQCIISIVLVLSRNLDQLISMVVFTGMFFNVLAFGAVFIYRRKFPDMERPYKVWGYPVIVIITIVIFALLMINTFIEDPVTALIGLAVPAIGCLVYACFDKQLKKGLDKK